MHRRSVRLHTSVDQTINQELLQYRIRNDIIERLTRFRLNRMARSIWRWWVRRIDRHTRRLNNHYRHMLLFGEDDWQEVPFSARFYIPSHDEWWDETSLIAHTTQQLNHADMNSPCVCYPSSPFTRIPYSQPDLSRLCRRRDMFDRSVPLSLRFLTLTQNRRLIHACHRMIKHEPPSHQLSRRVSLQLQDVLRRKLRYQLVNMHDSQGNYVGHWIARTIPLSDFEVIFRCWDRTRPIIFDQFNEMVTNPIKHFLKTLLQAFPREQPTIV